MKQASRIIDNQKTSIVQYLRQQLTISQDLLNDKQAQNEISEMLQYRQQKIYYFFVNDLNSYFGTIWDHIISANPDFEPVILDKMAEKQNYIYQDLASERLKIQQRQPILPFDYDEQSKMNKLNLLRQQSDDLKQKIKQINNNLDSDSNQNQFKDHKQLYAKLYSEQKIKQTEQFVKKYRQAQLERRKKLQQQKKKQEEQLMKKQAQIKQHQQLVLKERREEILKKQKQNQQMRSKQKQIRQQRNTQYMRIKKQINQKPPLYKKLYEGYSKRYDQQENQKITKMQSQRKVYLQHINSEIIQKHSKEYDQFKQKKEKQRKQKKQLQQSKQKSRTKVQSSYQIKKSPDPKQIEKELAKQKVEKMKQYKSIVKEKFKPKIDQDKKRELMNMIQQMQLNHKRVKRVRLDNGSVMYEQLPPVDAKMIGMSYLQQTKEMAARAREKKKDDKDLVEADLTKQIKKPINYLEELRKNRPIASRKHSVIDRKNMSFDDKVKHVMQESDRLAEVTKQNQMMLKFGKFKTSQQILACKEQIDQNYLDIVNMKLKLILSQQNPDTESQYSNN